MKDIHNYCIILAGGPGTRLWPYSRKNKPKQFLDFFGMGMTMLQHTYQRIKSIFDDDHILILTQHDYSPWVREQLPSISESNILTEAYYRNTAPAVTWAAKHLIERDPAARMAIIPADQLIINEEMYRQSLLKGLDFVAEHDKLLTLVIKPTRAETNYGYIQLSDDTIGDMHRVQAFTEKPTQQFADFFVECGEFFWNLGIFIWPAKRWLEEVSQHMPEVILPDKYTQSEKDVYAACRFLSIDFGLLERCQDVYAMVCNFGWMDMGSWEQYYEIAPKDGNNNAKGRNYLLAYNSHNNLVQLPHDKLVVLEDLDNYIITEHEDILVICPRHKAGNIRKYVNDVQVNLGDDHL